MKNEKKGFGYLWLAAFTVILASCTDNQPIGSGGSPLGTSVEKKPVLLPSRKDLCFQQVSGAGNKDTMMVHLTFKGDRVSGTMDELPFEKDARHGTLAGLLLQDEVKAVWRYTQEGMIDSLELEFRLGQDALELRPLITDRNTGRQYTDSAANYQVKIPSVPCR